MRFFKGLLKGCVGYAMPYFSWFCPFSKLWDCFQGFLRDRRENHSSPDCHCNFWFSGAYMMNIKALFLHVFFFFFTIQTNFMAEALARIKINTYHLYHWRICYSWTITTKEIILPVMAVNLTRGMHAISNRFRISKTTKSLIIHHQIRLISIETLLKRGDWVTLWCLQKPQIKHLNNTLRTRLRVKCRELQIQTSVQDIPVDISLQMQLRFTIYQLKKGGGQMNSIDIKIHSQMLPEFIEILNHQSSNIQATSAWGISILIHLKDITRIQHLVVNIAPIKHILQEGGPPSTIRTHYNHIEQVLQIILPDHTINFNTKKDIRAGHFITNLAPI